MGRGELVLDVVVHEVGLVTEWAARECVGDTVTITEAKGSFAMPDSAEWLLLVGDLTAMPAMARIAETVARSGSRPGSGRRCPTGTCCGGPATCGRRRGDLARASVRHVQRPGVRRGGHRLADRRGLLLDGGGVAQMRAIRKHLMRERRLPSTGVRRDGLLARVAKRQPRAVDRARSGGRARWQARTTTRSGRLRRGEGTT
nr:hypothetical protein [Nocardioides ungokensis]